MNSGLDDSQLLRVKKLGEAAEAKVLVALKKLPIPWQVFNTVEWRKTGSHGEEMGEADIVLFNPQHGVVVL